MTSASSSLPAPGQFLTFLVGGEEYAAPILQVREIVEFSDVTRMPAMPPCIRGVVNLRGQVVPVVDLSLRFGYGEASLSRKTCIVMVDADLDGDRTVVGLLVDSVSQVLDLHSQDIEPPPSFGTRIRVDFLSGLGKAASKFVLLLDLPRVLSVDELAQAHSLVASPPASDLTPPSQASQAA